MADRITDETRLEEALRAPLFVLFKHSIACGASHRVFREYEAFADAHPDVPTGWIEVREQRDWSQRIAAETGVAHESPQALVLRAGIVTWHASHARITADSLAAAVA